MTIGIYLLYFSEIDQVYIGQSTNITKRYRDHKSALGLQKHTNCKLQNAYNLYGFPNIEILEECSISDLDSLEVYWTNEFDSLNNGLNTCYPGKGAGSGTNNHNSKYTRLQLLLVFRKLYLTSGIADKTIGEMYGVHESTVISIRLGNSHLWLREDYPWQYARIKSKDNKDKFHTPNLIEGGIYLTDPSGKVHHIINIREFARNNGLDGSSISKVINGKFKQTKGWTK